jgi:hypothetical protein
LVGTLWRTNQSKQQILGFSKKIPTRNNSAGAWKLLCNVRALVATSTPVVKISAKGRAEPVVRKLPDVKPGTTLSRVSGSGQYFWLTCSRRTGTPRLLSKWTPSGEEDVWMRQKETDKDKGKGKRRRNWGHLTTRKCRRAQQGETLTNTLKRPRLEGSTPTETARPSKRLTDSSGQGTYK